MQQLLKTSIVLLAMAGLPHLAIAAPCSSGNTTDKYLQVYNNFTDKPIWLTLSGTLPEKDENRWLVAQKIDPQSCFQTIVPKEQWNAGRGYVYATDPTSASNPGAIDGNYQLFEYTYRGVDGPTVGSTGVGVGYNYSAVDSLHSYLPLALEAANANDNSNAETYTGNPMPGLFGSSNDAYNTDSLQQVQELVDAGWPYFAKSSLPGSYYKILGGYNLFALSSDQGTAYSQKAKQQITPDFLVRKWRKWLDTPPEQICTKNAYPDQAFCLEYQQSVKKVWNGFLTNAKANGVNNPSDIEMAAHITGFVNFYDAEKKDNTNWTGIIGTDAVDATWIALASGVPSLEAEYQKQKYPDYDSIYNLDPYVTAVHKNLNLNIYSFSIDDAVGYVDAPTQNKLIVAIGGLNGLPNTKQRTLPKKSVYNSNFGPGWSKVTACGDVSTLDTSTGSFTPLEFTGDTCNVTYTGSSADQTLSYTAMLKDNRLSVSACDDSKAGGSICQGVTVATDNPKIIVGPPTPSDNGGGGENTGGFIAYAPGYSGIASTNSNCVLKNNSSNLDSATGGQLELTVANNKPQTCVFELDTPSTINAAQAFMLTLNLPSSSSSAASLSCTQKNASKTCIAQPTLLKSGDNYQIYVPMAKDL